MKDEFWYLACPYSDPDPEVRRTRFEAANQAAAWMMKKLKLAVYSPISMGHPIAQAGAPGGWKAWKGLDLAILESPLCLGIVVLQLAGWAESVGVLAETEAAERLGKPVRYMREMPRYRIAADPLDYKVE